MTTWQLKKSPHLMWGACYGDSSEQNNNRNRPQIAFQESSWKTGAHHPHFNMSANFKIIVAEATCPPPRSGNRWICLHDVLYTFLNSVVISVTQTFGTLYFLLSWSMRWPYRACDHFKAPFALGYLQLNSATMTTHTTKGGRMGFSAGL